MSVSNQIKVMKKEGMVEEQITNKLKEQGISPKEINDAFQREKIKEAVSKESYGEMPHDLTPPRPGQGSFYVPKTQDLSQAPEEIYTPQEMAQEQFYPPQPQDENYYSPQEYGNEQYPEGYEQTGGGYDTDTIIEIAEQVFEEKIQKIEKKLNSLTEFATLAETKIVNNNERIKRIETMIDKLQITILEKIGSYGKDIENTKKEMEMMQESFSKVLPEIAKKHKTHSKK